MSPLGASQMNNPEISAMGKLLNYYSASPADMPSPPEEQRILACLEGVYRINQILRDTPTACTRYIGQARSIIAVLNTTNFISGPSNIQNQALLVATLQRLAYHDPDNGSVTDIATWCSYAWLQLLLREPQNVMSLQGVGQAWLWQAQPALARIHNYERTSSSSGDSPSRCRQDINSSGAQQLSRVVARDAEERLGLTDYVEARALLQPASEYLERAVSAATAQSVLTGDLLAVTAEAYMSLGNVSSERINTTHFQRAIVLLRVAATTPGYSLNAHLQQYLDDYGRLVDS